MSLLLNLGTTPNGLEVRTQGWQTYMYDHPGSLVLGDYSFPVANFLSAAKHVLNARQHSTEGPSWTIEARKPHTQIVVSILGWEVGKGTPSHVEVGEYTLSLEDFLATTEYLLRNFNLNDSDPRVDFVHWVKQTENARKVILSEDDPRCLFMDRVVVLEPIQGYPAYYKGKLLNPNDRRLGTKDEADLFKTII